MKWKILLLLTLLTNSAAIAQQIDKIIVSTQAGDEPPTKEGQPVYIINFLRTTTGEFAAREFYRNSSQVMLTEVATIEKRRVEMVFDWIGRRKRDFRQEELGVDSVITSEKLNQYGLNFNFPPNIVVHVDSFNFCRHAGWPQLRHRVFGGNDINVSLVEKSGALHEFRFTTLQDVGSENMDLSGFLLCYRLLESRIPVEIPQYGFFSRENLIDILFQYQKGVECEGYYYGEYCKKNPKRTPQERRMMAGCNFIEYMKQRSR